MERHTRVFWGDHHAPKMSPNELVCVLDVVRSTCNGWDWTNLEIPTGLDATTIFWVRVSSIVQQHPKWPVRGWNDYHIRVRRACERFDRYLKSKTTRKMSVSRKVHTFLLETGLCSILHHWNIDRLLWEAKSLVPPKKMLDIESSDDKEPGAGVNGTLTLLCDQTLRQITSMLWADETVRLTMVGCRLLTQKLSSAVHDFYFRSDPWFSHKCPTSTAQFPHVTTLVTTPSMSFVKFRWALQVMPQTLTSLELASIAHLHDLWRKEPLNLPHLTRLRVCHEHTPPFNFKMIADQNVFVTLNALQRRNMKHLTIDGKITANKLVGIHIEALPQELEHLQISFLVEFFNSSPNFDDITPEDEDFGHPLVPNSLPNSLRTIIVSVQHTTRDFFEILPPDLTRLHYQHKGPTKMLTREHSSLLPRGLLHFIVNVHVVRCIPPDDMLGFFSGLPHHLITFSQNYPFTMMQYNAIPEYLKASLKDLPVSAVFGELPYLASHGILRSNVVVPQIMVEASYVDLCGTNRYTCAYSVVEPLHVRRTPPDIDSIKVTILETKSVVIRLNIPPKTRSLKIRYGHDIRMVPASRRLDVPVWPASLTQLKLDFNIPISLPLASFQHLTILSFYTHNLATYVSRLPPTLRTLLVTCSPQEAKNVEVFLCSLPKLLSELRLKCSKEFAVMQPHVAVALPRGLVHLSIVCWLAKECAPFLPPQLCKLESKSNWFVNRSK